MISSFQNTGRSLSNKPVLVCTVWPSKIMIFVCMLKRVSPIRIIETKIFGFVGTKHENIQSNRTAYWLQTSARFQLSASCGARCEVLEASCISQTQSLGDPVPPRWVLPRWGISKSKPSDWWGSSDLGEARPETGRYRYCTLVSFSVVFLPTVDVKHQYEKPRLIHRWARRSLERHKIRCRRFLKPILTIWTLKFELIHCLFDKIRNSTRLLSWLARSK